MGFKGCRTGEPDETERYPNIPASTPMIVQALAKCYGLDVDTVARHTTENARRLFRF